MKKIIFLTFVVISLLGCTEADKKSVATEEEVVETNVSDRTKEVLSQLEPNSGVTYTDYQEACENNDFTSAHKILSDMKNKVEKMRQSTFTPKKKRMAAESELRDATKYVLSKESKWLIGMIETACEDQDFEKAHILNRELKKRCDVDNTKFVVLKEAKFLASMNKEEATQRILYLINDIEDETERSDVARQIFELAETTGNDYLKKALEKLVKKD
jgi:hypothetical protein